LNKPLKQGITRILEPNMFNIFKSYDDEYAEPYNHLTQEWKMKPEYAKAFLDAYKKNIGKMLAEGKQRVSALRNSPNTEG
jgi:hypothetical protein